MQMEQSMVGKVLSIWAILPPIEGSFSTMCTSKPESARSRADWMPATPPPMIRTDRVTGTLVSSCSSSRRTFATAIRTRSLALSVPCFFSYRWIHEQCSRMLAISKRYLLRPPRSTVARKVGSCSRGEQEATTIRLRSCSAIMSSIVSWPGSEQVYF